jgi:hypothetical protein
MCDARRKLALWARLGLTQDGVRTGPRGLEWSV